MMRYHAGRAFKRKHMKHVLLTATFAVCGLAAFPADASAAPKILLPPSASKATRIAAAEFGKYWREICGNEIAVDEKDDGISSYVKIGQPAADMVFDPKFDTYYVRSVADGGRTNLVLAGGNARSTIYAVYDFLERRCGCRWFWDGDVVPKSSSIDIGGLDVRECSRFEFRATHYFAHRGLTRFQATHWGLEDWKREIDFCLKSRLNFFMLQIGLDDIFQRAFPDVVSYPDPSVTQPPERPDRPGYDNHSPHWDLAYRGKLRKAIVDYAYDRGMMHPAEFGTLTHWFSRTPQEFLDKMKPPFLQQASRGYSEPSGLIWDICQPKWFDMYWRITEAQIASWYKPDYLFTPGFDERTMYKDRERNLRFKTDVVKRYLDKASSCYPQSRLLIEGWDLYNSWESSEVREFIPHLDPKTTIIWDYEADASSKGHFNGRNFTEWNVVGRFPYVFGMLMSLERACDIRLDYDIITVRQRVIRDDPFCVGYMLWPETSHSDAFAWRYFASNCWRLSDSSVHEILAEFCRDRYAGESAAFESVWRKVLPVSMLGDWWSIYAVDVTTSLRSRWNDADKLDRLVFPQCLRRAPEIFRDIAELRRQSPFAARDAIDLARTVGDRLIIASGGELAKRYWHLGEAGCKADDIEKYAAAYVAAGEAMARVLAMHSDYSLVESLDRLSTIHPVPNPDFEHVLFENAANTYCRSHQAEFAAHWYIDDMRDNANDVVAAARCGGGKKLPKQTRFRMKELMALPHPIRSQALDLPRTDENYRKAMLDFAAAADVLTAPKVR